MDAEIGSLFKKKFQFRQKLQNQRFSCKFPFENNSWNVCKFAWICNPKIFQLPELFLGV